MITEIIQLGDLEERLNTLLAENWQIKSVARYNGEWVVELYYECNVCKGPCEDPDIGICDSCAGKAYGRLEMLL